MQGRLMACPHLMRDPTRLVGIVLMCPEERKDACACQGAGYQRADNVSCDVACKRTPFEQKEPDRTDEARSYQAKHGPREKQQRRSIEVPAQ